MIMQKIKWIIDNLIFIFEKLIICDIKINTTGDIYEKLFPKFMR